MTASRPALDHELVPWLTLFLAPGVGPATFSALLRHYPGPAAVLQRPQHFARLLGEKGLASVRHPDQGRLRRHLDWQHSPGNAIITRNDPRYPPLLAETVNPPPLLFAMGRLELLQKPALAMVGSRNPSPRGRENAFALARLLAGSGYTICSGLALGIDGAAHQGALGQAASTIAVLGTGIDQIYPPRHQQLYQRIGAEGLLLSEFPLATGPHRSRFPRRNRIISGLSAGTIVVEAGLKSGSLITARFAAEQGRDVFAIPGNIHHPGSRGCHQLIKDGAKLVENGADILEELPEYQHPGHSLCQTETRAPRMATAKPGADLSPRERQVLENLDDSPTSVDELINRSGLTTDEVSSILMVLELQGHVSATADQGRYIRLNPDNAGDSYERKCLRSPHVSV